MEGFFARTCQSITSHGGRLCACRSAKRFCNPRKIHGWIFRGVTYAGLEGPPQAVAARQWRRKPKPCKARDAEACPVELAKEQNGRAEKSSSIFIKEEKSQAPLLIANHGSTSSPTVVRLRSPTMVRLCSTTWFDCAHQPQIFTYSCHKCTIPLY